MEKKRLGVAVVGAGVVGRMRARVVGRSPGARLVGVADTDLAAAQRAAAPSASRAVEDYRQLLDDVSVDAVIVASPAPMHRDMVLDALRAGKHVLCEKPLATSVEDCRAIVNEARARERVVAVGFNHRYYPCVKFLKGMVDSGSLGQIVHVRALAGHRGVSEFRADWMYQGHLSGGGAMMDIGIHLTDLVRYVAGDIAQVYGVATSDVWHVPGSEDHAAATLRTTSGIAVSYHATWGEWKGYRLILDVYGTRGTTRAFYAPMLNLHSKRDGGKAATRWQLYPWVNVREKLFGWETTAELAFAEEFEDFLNALDGKWKNIAAAEDGLRAVEIAAAVYESSRSGQAVTLVSPG